MNSIKKLHTNQSGLVSIVVAIVFITIISLITLSFALLMRREARQALDRQLSTQAFYAAESGINDAVNSLASIGNNDDCDNNVTGKNPDLGNGLEYTCVLVNQNPTSLEYSSVDTNDSTIARIKADQTIQKIRISWNAAEGGSTNFADNNQHNLPQASISIGDPNSFSYVGGGTGIVRATLIPVIPGEVDRAQLTENAQTSFLYPLLGDTTAINQRSYTENEREQGDFIDGNCNASKQAPRYCSIEITNLPASADAYYIRLKSIYHNSNVVVEAFSSNASTSPLSLTGTQSIIDATGKANDVLRRIQVRVPLNTRYYYPEFALESVDDICKLLITIPPNTVDRTRDVDCHND